MESDTRTEGGEGEARSARARLAKSSAAWKRC